MSIRITDSMKFNSTLSSLFTIQTQHNELTEQISSQKRINRISDDPLGISKVLQYKQTNLDVSQYERNIDNASTWLTETESKLTSASELLSNARAIAVAQNTGTANVTTRDTAAKQIESIISEMASLANAKLGNRYLFSGSSVSTEPFSTSEQAARIETAEASTENSYTGTVISGGTYTGNATKTYAVKIVDGGTLAAATYKVSTDGGKTWGATQSDLDTGTITVGNGVQLTFTNTGDLATDDFFHVTAYAEGYYNGNGGGLPVNVASGVSFDYNITGEEAFTAQGAGSADAFAALNDLKTALEDNDITGISNAISVLKDAQEQADACIARCGSRQERLEMTKNNLAELETSMTTLISGVEDADLAELATQYALKDVALQATYSVASKLGQNSIIDFLT